MRSTSKQDCRSRDREAYSIRYSKGVQTVPVTGLLVSLPSI